MTKIAREAGVPLVYVNRRPAEETLPDGVVFVGSEDLQAGTLEMEELARLMNHRGNVAIMVGELASNGAQLRTKAVEDVVAKYPGMKIVEKQVGNFQRERGLDLMNNWLTAGTEIDAVAATTTRWRSAPSWRFGRRASRREDPRRREWTPRLMRSPSWRKARWRSRCFRTPADRRRGAVDAAVKLSRGEKVDSFVWIPFELVTRDNYKTFSVGSRQSSVISHSHQSAVDDTRTEPETAD